jgi:hypothetical protein
MPMANIAPIRRPNRLNVMVIPSLRVCEFGYDFSVTLLRFICATSVSLGFVTLLSRRKWGESDNFIIKPMRGNENAY